MKDEVVAGLKNAIERGTSLEKAVQSFINAGYDPNEVREAAKDMNNAALPIISSAPAAQAAASKSSPADESQPAFSEEELTGVPKPDSQTETTSASATLPSSPAQPEEKKSGISRTKVIMLVSVLVVLLLLLGASFFFRQQIASLFGG